MQKSSLKIRSLIAVLVLSSLAFTACGKNAKNVSDKGLEKTEDKAIETTIEEYVIEEAGTKGKDITEVNAEEITKDKYEISSEKVKVYYKGQFGEDEEEIKMYFLNGNKQIAYYDMDTVCYLMTKLYRDGYGDYEKDKEYALTYETHGDEVVFSRENGYTMTLDFAKDNVVFYDYDEFIGHSFDITTVDLAHYSGYNEEGQPVYLKRNVDQSFSRYGKELIFDLAKYNIKLVKQGGQYLIPAQTMNDILLTATYTEYLYNGESAIYANYADLKYDISNGEGLAKVFYRDDIEPRSKELIEFSYNELCMLLDYEYGLKDTHQIEDFDSYFEEVGINNRSLKNMLLDEDPVVTEKALYALVSTAFDDLHSSYYAPSAYAGYDHVKEIKKSSKKGASTNHLISIYRKLVKQRAEMLGDEDGKVPGYQEVGNTAYVTFDKFTDKSEDYYLNPPTSEPDDAVGLIIYANSQIKRENSPIENVVIDLTCNLGGAEDSVAFVCS